LLIVAEIVDRPFPHRASPSPPGEREGMRVERHTAHAKLDRCAAVRISPERRPAKS
jgi:hypothetical protein